MAKILITGGLGWDVPIWLDAPITSGGRIIARTLGARTAGGAIPGRLGGGAANAAAALAQAGHDVWVLGRIGRDGLGELILDALTARGIKTDVVLIDDVQTTSAQILIEPSGERTILGLGWDMKALVALSRQTFVPPPQLSELEFDCLIQRATWPPLTIRPKLVIGHVPIPCGEHDADVVVGGLSDLDRDAWDQPLAAVRKAFPNAAWGIVTDGKNGLVAQSEEERFSVCLDPWPVVDATGAGDVFLAGLADALLATEDMGAACAHAASWGRLCVAMQGSAVAPDDIRFNPFIHEPNAI